MAEQLRLEDFLRLLALVQPADRSALLADMQALVTQPTAPEHITAPGLSERNLHQFADREQRRADRLVRAAYGVGQTKEWFRALPRAMQVEKVREWVGAAQQHAADRRAGIEAA